MRHVLRQRQRNINPVGHIVVTSVLGGVALLLCGSIYADAHHRPEEALTKGDAAFLVFVIIVGICAAAAAAAASSVRDARRRAAEEDVIRECHQQQQLSAIHDAITVFLRDGDESALKAMAQTRGLMDTGTDPEMGTVHRFRGRR
ncbi:hypothetical protein ACGFIY_21680 [Micromonospora chersina]|uniref:hypothetical protein n=1 Tax=Micromonospora chersina TaxID=47854 RepID=UPI0037148D71